MFASIAVYAALAVSCLGGGSRNVASIRLADAVVAVNFDTGACKSGSEWTKAAADDLTNVIFKVTGRLAPVYSEGTEPQDARAVIYLGDTKAARAAGIDPGAMRNGDWRVKAVPGKVFVYGKTGKGASFAMTEFVERFCGYAFLSPDGEDPFTFNPGLEIPVCDVAVRPAIYDRGIYHGVRYTSRFSKDEFPMWDRFSRRRRSPEFYGAEMENTRRISAQVKSCHSFYEYLPPAKYFKEHPEWYSMNKAGQRTAKMNAESQLCFSNREMWKELLKSLERFVERDRKQRPTGYPCVYDFSQMDNSDFICLCPECKKVIAKYNRVPGGHKEGGDAGLMLECINWLAREIARKYPDVQIRTFAYVSTGCAPKPGTIKVEPNVVIRWCDVYSVSDHSRPLETPGHFNAKQAAELGDWLSLTRNVHLWDYMLYGNTYPEVCVEAFSADAKFFARNGLETIFMETEYGRQPFYLLNYYLLSQLYIDPSLDPWALVRKWCRVYGPAADEMYEAIRFADRLAFENPAPTAYDWHIRNLPWRTRENMEALAALVRKAYTKLGPDRPKERARVAHALASTLQELIRLLMPKTDAESRSALEAAKAEFLKCLEVYAADGCICEADRPKVRQGAHDVIDLMSLKFKDLPPELKDVPKVDLVCVDYHRSWNKDDDPASERGRTTFARWGSYKFGLPTGCGIYDWGTKDSFPFTLRANGAVEGKYFWQKLGVAHLGSHTAFWFPSSWLNRIELKSYYILADGLPVDPNWYEVWVSAKIEGPTVFPGSTRKDLLAVDRMALRRVPPPPPKAKGKDGGTKVGGPNVNVSLFIHSVRRAAKQRNVSLADAAEMLYKVGVRGVDIDPDDPDLPAIYKTKLKPINFFFFPKMFGPDNGAADCRRCLDQAVKYGVPRVMVVPTKFTEGGDEEAEFAKVLSSMKMFVAEGRKRGITITVEDFGGTSNPCSHAKYLKRLLDEIPELRFALDSGNMYYAGRGESIVDMMNYAKGRIAHVHLKDQSAEDNHKFVSLGLGAVPNEKVVRTVSALGYKEWYTLENPVGDVCTDVARQISVLKSWLEAGKVGRK